MADYSGSMPLPLPANLPGYDTVWSYEHHMFYYMNRETGQKLWTAVISNAVAGAAIPHAASQAVDALQPSKHPLPTEDEDVNSGLRQSSSPTEDEYFTSELRHVSLPTEDEDAAPKLLQFSSQTEDEDVTSEMRQLSSTRDSEDIQKEIDMLDHEQDSPANGRKRQHSQSGGSHRADSFISEADTDSAELTEKPRKKQAVKKPAAPLYVAQVEETAARVIGSTADLGDATLLKIKKMLSRADQPGANESEAKTALRRADQLMRRLNITRADVLAHNPEGQNDFAGHSIVTIRRTDGNAELPVRLNYWVGHLCHAIGLFFAVKSYTTKVWMRDQHKTAYVRVTFYGLAENTVTAVHSFQMVYNLIGHHALDYKGIPSRNSYSEGVCRGLQQSAEIEKEEEEIAAKQAGEKEHERRVQQDDVDRQAELNRLKAPNVEAYFSDEDDDDAPHIGGNCGSNGDYAGLGSFDTYPQSPVSVRSGEDATGGYGSDQSNEDDDGYDDNSADDDSDGGGDDVTQNLPSVLVSPEPEPSPNRPTLGPVVKPAVNIPPPSTSSAPLADNSADDEEVARWDSHTALITYRHQADEIANNYLKEIGQKLKTGRKTTAKKFDRAAYDRGKEDAKKIDVRRKAIADRCG